MSIDPVKSAANLAPYVALQQDKPATVTDFGGDAVDPNSGVTTRQDSVSLTPGKGLAALGKISDYIEQSNSLAKTLSGAVAVLKQAVAPLDQAKQELIKIVKNYPPYGIDSEDRRSILRSYAALRKEIDSMTIPTPPRSYYEQNSGTLGQFFDSNGRLAVGDVPTLPLDAPDQHVHAAVAALDGKIASFSSSSQAISDLFNAR